MTRLEARAIHSILALLAFWAAMNSAAAGQPRNAAPVDEKTANMSIEELRAYQAYYYAAGGKDPMSMRLPTDAELGLDDKMAEEAITLEQMERQMEEALRMATAYMKERKYAEAIKVSGEIIFKIDNNEWPPIKADQFNLRRMEEELRNYNRTAVRLLEQEAIKEEFHSLHLRVDGVTWSPTDAKTVVNGKLFAAGEVMLEERKQEDLRIEVIEEHGVVFQFKGMRFRLPVEVYSPQSAVPPGQR